MLSNLRVRTKIFTLSFIMFLMITAITGIAIHNEIVENEKTLSTLGTTIRKDYDNNIKNQVENIITLLDGINKKYENGEMTLIQAKKLGADLIRGIRYDNDGYFWADTTDGTNIVLLGSSTEGTNRYNYKDVKGNLIVQKVIKNGMKENGGYADYWFPKVGSSTPLPKRAYSKLFKPFDWVIGTGIYTDDIDKIIAQKRAAQNKLLNYNLMVYVILASGFIFLAEVITYIISVDITYPLTASVQHAKKISQGILDTIVPEKYKKRKDEMGALAVSFEKMQNGIISLVSKLEDKSLALENEKELLHTTLVSVGDGIISTDENGNITFMNSSAEKIIGFQEIESIGKPFEQVFRVVNGFTEELLNDTIKNVFSTGKITELDSNTVLISKSGKNIPVESSIAPIKINNGSIVGVILVFRNVAEKRKRQGKIEYLSYHDQLTGLYNRRFFQEEQERLDVQDNYPLSLIMADVNGLKLTNDAFGHLAGDELLQKASETMRRECRADDVVARIGGDEFVILLPRIKSDEAQSLVRRIKKAISMQKVGPINISISFGFATKDRSYQTMDEIFKKAEDNMYKEKLFESQSIRGNIINVLANTMYKKIKGEEEYYYKISNTCRAIGKRMGLSTKDVEELKTAGLLHDIGNITIDESIFIKSDKLAPEEWLEIKHHCEAGYHILSSVNDMAKISEYVLAHHERWDGTGYPKGLIGEEIPLQSRIIAVADAYNAMTSDRPYRNACTKEHAIEEIKNNSGTQFDPEVVNAFLELQQEI